MGWFPEAYVEPMGKEESEKASAVAVTSQGSVDFGAAEVAAETGMYVALFPYNSEEPGDLIFEAGEKIEVIKKENEWWTGKIGDKTGVFPYNYVEAAGSTSGAGEAGSTSADAGEAGSTSADPVSEDGDKVSFVI